MSNAAQEILVAGARALAHADGLEASLQLLLASIATQLEVESAAVFVKPERPGRLEMVASIGLGDEARAGLASAVDNPGHPIARTFAMSVSSFNVLPTAPGGPAWRSHLPLTVTRERTDIVLGVLALAHDRAIDSGLQPLLQAGADLAAIAVERHRRLAR
jgi:hypothetical protein